MDSKQTQTWPNVKIPRLPRWAWIVLVILALTLCGQVRNMVNPPRTEQATGRTPETASIVQASTQTPIVPTVPPPTDTPIPLPTDTAVPLAAIPTLPPAPTATLTPAGSPEQAAVQKALQASEFAASVFSADYNPSDEGAEIVIIYSIKQGTSGAETRTNSLEQAASLLHAASKVGVPYGDIALSGFLNGENGEDVLDLVYNAGTVKGMNWNRFHGQAVLDRADVKRVAPDFESMP